jgi:hypothetical protein
MTGAVLETDTVTGGTDGRPGNGAFQKQMVCCLMLYVT